MMDYSSLSGALSPTERAFVFLGRPCTRCWRGWIALTRSNNGGTQYVYAGLLTTRGATTHAVRHIIPHLVSDAGD